MMIARRLCAALLALALTACAREPADPARPESYAITLPVSPAPGDGLQRIDVPASALVALARRDGGDLRVFDATGRAMPLALLHRPAATVKAQVPVPVYPVLGAGRADRLAGMTLRLEGTGKVRIAGLEGESAPDGGGDAVAGALLDTRTLADPASAVLLDADLPRGVPVTFTLSAGDNLRDWSALGEKVLLRVDAGPAVLGDGRIALGGANLARRYVLVTWSAAGGRDAQVAVKGARIETERAGPAGEIAVTARAPQLKSAHEVLFSLPFATPLAGLRLRIAAQDGVVPATLSARASAEAPWQVLASTTLRREDGAGGTRIALGGNWRHYRIEADRRTAGFSRVPDIELLLAPVELAVRFDGRAPYRLAAGMADAPATFLTPAEIARQGKAETLAALPLARAGEPGAATPVVSVDPADLDKAGAQRKLALWAVLALGTLVLGLAALKLLRTGAARRDGAGEG